MQGQSKQKYGNGRLKKMEKSLFEQIHDIYEKQGDYFLLCLALPTKEEKQYTVSGICGI